MGGPTSVGSISRYLQDPISRPVCVYVYTIDRSRLDPSVNANYQALFLFIIDCCALVSRLFKLLFSRREPREMISI